MSKKLESDFQAKLIKEIKEMLPGCLVMKTDPTYIQGLPDLLILYRNRWAALECKRESSAHHQPNQDYYVSRLNKMSFAEFIYPENKTEVLHELQRTLQSGRQARLSRCKPECMASKK